MFYTLCYYTALAGSFGISLAGITFYFNRPLFDDVSRRMAWKGLELYHDITMFIENIMKKSPDEDEEEDPDWVKYSKADYSETPEPEPTPPKLTLTRDKPLTLKRR